MNDAKTICIAGASGLVGANLTKAALARDCQVRGTLRDSSDTERTGHLYASAGARERPELFSVDMSRPGAFDEALSNADAVFIACLIPTYSGPSGKPSREMDDQQGEKEIVMPTVDGCLNIPGSAPDAGITYVIICWRKVGSDSSDLICKLVATAATSGNRLRPAYPQTS